MKNRKISRCFLLFGLLMPALLGAGPESNGFTYESPIFTGTGELYRPVQELEQGGKRYRLVSERIRQATKAGTLTYVSTSVPYELEGREEPPETAVIPIKDEATGTEFEREVPLIEIIEQNLFWSDDFSFPVTVSGYDADSFILGDEEIPAEASLSDYGEEFLTYLGLPSDCYRVETVAWEGDAYEKDGILCRDALATGEKLVRRVEAKYGGQVRTPEVEGKQYIGIYEEIIPETEEETEEESVEQLEERQTETQEIRQTEEVTPDEPSGRGSFVNQVLRWLERNLTVIKFGGMFFLVISGTILLLFMTRKKKSNKGKENMR